MFKRQYYALEHADNGNASSSDSSSLNTGSDGSSGDEQDDAASPSHGEEPPESESEEDGDGEPPESESEDEEWSAYRSSKGREVQALDSSRFLLNQWAEAAEGAEEEKIEERVGDSMVLRIGDVLKCRLCVKIICLSDDTMKAHLLSKRHARSLKQLVNGKLKVQLNSDGEEEEEGETHAERLARIRSVAEEKVAPVKRKANFGRQRQRKRVKRKALSAAKETPQSTPGATPAVLRDEKVATPLETPKSRKSSKLTNGLTNNKSPNVATGASATPTVVSTVKMPASLETPTSTKRPNKKSRKSTEVLETPKATLEGPRVADDLKRNTHVAKSPKSLPGNTRSSDLRKKNLSGSLRRDKVRKRKSLQ